MLDAHLLSTQNLYRIGALDEFFLFEREGSPNSAGGIMETNRLKYETFRNWTRTVFAKTFPMG